MSSGSFAHQTHSLMQAITSRTKSSKATATFESHVRKVQSAGADSALADAILLYTYTSGAYKPDAAAEGRTDRMAELLKLIAATASEEYIEVVTAAYKATEGFKITSGVFMSFISAGRYPLREGWTSREKFMIHAAEGATQLSVMAPKDFTAVRINVALRCVLEFAGNKLEGAVGVALLVKEAATANPCDATKVLASAAHGVITEDAMARRSSRFTKDGIAHMRDGRAPPSTGPAPTVPASAAEAAERIKQAVVRSKAKAGHLPSMAVVAAAAAAASGGAGASTTTAPPAV